MLDCVTLEELISYRFPEHTLLLTKDPKVKELVGKMPKIWKKNKTTEGYFLGEQISSPILLEEEEQCLPSGKDIKVKVSVSQTSKINIQWSQAMEELKKDFENQVREVEGKLGREMREMQENHEK